MQKYIFSIRSPAKLNLFLEILDRRPDGYHNLKTLFAKTSLCDEIHFSPFRRLQISWTPKNIRLPKGRDNLIVRAAMELQKTFCIREGAGIHLVKNIPVGAGLGGGSSNAAATLRGLCRLWKIPRRPATREKLTQIARRLGADVSFFLQDHPFCIGEGTGDILRPLPDSGKYWAVLLYPGVSVSTPWAYQRLSRLRRPPLTPLNLTRADNLDRLAVCLRRRKPPEEWVGLLFNRFEEIVLSRFPQVRKAVSALRTRPTLGVMMSGSGSSVFGIVPDPICGREILNQLQDAYPSCYLIRIG